MMDCVVLVIVGFEINISFLSNFSDTKTLTIIEIANLKLGSKFILLISL